ncbi:MAG: hypothetical protein QXR45_08380 [Candidatus Bathyarchaeia archaeon]
MPNRRALKLTVFSEIRREYIPTLIKVVRARSKYRVNFDIKYRIPGIVNTAIKGTSEPELDSAIVIP